MTFLLCLSRSAPQSPCQTADTVVNLPTLPMLNACHLLKIEAYIPARWQAGSQCLAQLRLHNPTKADLTSLHVKAVPFVRDRLAKLAGKTFLFLDTCHSGLVENLNLTANRTLGWKSAQQTASTKAAEQVAEAGVVAFSACRGNQFAKEDLTLGHGYFTLAVTEGLDGKADLDGSTEVTVAELTRYVADRVNEFSGGQQTAWKAPLESLHEGFVLSHPTNP